MPISNWDDLRIFMAVGRAGGIAAAGRALRLDHSTVVRRLAGLEEEMGARLADRLPTGVRLTAAGLELFSHAERMEAEAKAADLRLSGVDEGRSEEHTSELQSLMRSSYAVFCLKK